VRKVAIAFVGASLAALAFVTAACGGDDSTSSNTVAPTKAATRSGSPAASATSAQAPTQAKSTTTTLKDPCSYVTKDEVATTTGKTISGDAVKVNDFVCRYPTADQGTVNVGVAPAPVKATWEAAVKANAGAQTPTPIANLGDEAFAVPFGVSAIKGTT
jgi:hypothetical protein